MPLNESFLCRCHGNGSHPVTRTQFATKPYGIFLNEWCLFTQKDIICVTTEPFFFEFCIVSVLFYAKVGFGGKTPNYICEMAVIKKRKQK